MNCYLDTTDRGENVNCTRIRTKGSTTLLINVSSKRRPEDYYTAEEGDHPDSEILYSVTDVSDVEQGQGGFVSAIKAMHDTIAVEQTNRVRRDSSRSDDLTEQLEAFMPELGRTGKKCFRTSSIRGTPPRDGSKLSRTGSATGTPKDERVLSRASSSASSTCDELSSKGVEFIRAESEIVYSLSDVSDIEQGQGGFVKSLKAMHDAIGTDKPSGRSDSVGSSGRKSISKNHPFSV